MTVARGGETWSFIRYFKELFQATQNLPPRQNLSFLSRGETPPAAQCESRMEPESAEVASRARDAARAAATASAEAATLEAAAEFERAALRARRDVSVARVDGQKTRVDVPRTPREAETRARRTREAALEERRAREMARMRAAAARAACRGGNLSVRSAAALDAERRARWQTHEARWASFCRDDQASPLAAPFPASGEDLLLALQSVFLREDSDAREGATRTTAADGTPTAARGAVVFGEDASAASPPSRARALHALKRAFRAAALRWHPDKFLQTFASRVARADAAETALTQRKVAETFRDVREAYDRVYKETLHRDDAR